MKKLIRFLLLAPLAVALLIVTAQAAGDIFGYIKATSQGDQIVLQWRTTSETGIHSFEIERKSEEVTDFRRVGRIDAKGNGSTYQYTDNGAFFKSEAARQFTYRIKAVGPSVEQYSTTSTATHEVSSVRRSWGMIKELFR
jgi:hypothetical protein